MKYREQSLYFFDKIKDYDIILKKKGAYYEFKNT